MNKTEVITEISQISGIGKTECIKVVDALEEVLCKELDSSENARTAFDKIYGLMNLLRNK
jgi:nucleoid DNA-binding protein